MINFVHPSQALQTACYRAVIAIHGGLNAVPAPPASTIPSKTPQKAASIPSIPQIPSAPVSNNTSLSSSDLANAYLQQLVSPRPGGASSLPKTTPGRLHNHFITNLNSYDSPNKV